MSSPADTLAAFWNARYAEPSYVYGKAPNDFLVAQLPRLRQAAQGQPVLCLADGEGRNSVWLARQGFDVTALEIAEQGLAKARALAQQQGVALHTVQADVTAWDLGTARWGAIVSIFLHLPPGPRRALHARCLRALRPGGVFVYEAYGPEQPRYGSGGPKEAALLPDLAALREDFAGGSIEHAWSGVRAVHEGPLHSGNGQVNQLVVTPDPSHNDGDNR